MPPRSAKKGPAAKKTPARGKAAAKSQNHAEEPVKVEAVEEDVSASADEFKEEIKAEEVVEEKIEKSSVPDSKENGSVDAEDEADMKAAYEEDKGERLDLEDIEPEYEPEEETAVDYGEKDIELGGEQEEEDEGEGMVDEEEETDMVDAEMEDDGEDAEGEEDIEGEEEGHEVDVDEEEHHEVVKERRKRKEFEVFVGGLDKDATEHDLKKVFSEVGEITEVRLMMNPVTKKNKGFAFLRFATVEQARRAVSELKTPVVNGKQCGVAPSQDSDTLFVGNICKTWTKEVFKEKLKKYGIENVEELTLVPDSGLEGRNRGFAFLEFSKRSEAIDACKRLQTRDVFFGVDRIAKVTFADSFIEPDDEIMGLVKTVFVDGVSAAWDEDDVKGFLKKYGTIEKIELARNMPLAKRKDFGFVTFDTHDNAVACADGINNAELGEGDNKVKVRARLSRPEQRGRGKHGARGDFRSIRGVPRGRLPYGRPPPRSFPLRGTRPVSSRAAPVGSRSALIGNRSSPIGGRGFKQPIGIRDRRPVMAALERPRHLPPPERSYDRRPPIPPYPKSSMKREYSRYDEPPRSRAAAVEYAHRVPTERRSTYREDYSSRGAVYSDLGPRSASRTADRRMFVDEGYGRKLERPLPSYREGHGRDYDSLSGSKRPYSELDAPPPRYADASIRQSRARLEYGVSGSGGSSQYTDAYGDRLGRSHIEYGSSRTSFSDEDGLYGSHHGMGYGGGGRDAGGMYSSFSSNYLSRGSDVGGSSYSSLYSGRGLGGSRYMSGNGSGSFY